MHSINERIRSRYQALTSGQKAVAALALKEPQQLAIHTAKEIGAATGTSEATVIRFCSAIGYAGYSALQDAVRKSLLAAKRTDHTLRSIAELPQSTDQRQLPLQIAKQDAGYMELTAKELDHESLSRAVELIGAAAQIVVVGLRAAYAPAHWLAYSLNVLRGNTTLYRGEMEDAYALISQMNESTLVIALSFPRYTSETVHFVEAARRMKAHVLAITDNELSPIGRHADALLKVVAPPPVTLSGITVVFSLLHMLIGSLIARDGERVQRRIDDYEAAGQHFYSFYKEPE
ncbi:MurR/RpiR family transcriptional regulator [Paenibacillus cymbidii]|uniref:MurR/RpiR family transcriptional regulator n=1 Tax=Paenibacillus cymbidii TaxID=1639034 RepID=UPI0014367D8D|nr:MurR/RpiR family transcriptional regulator [Paenibacillus cymbidii]